MIGRTVHKGMYIVGIMLMRERLMTHVETICLLSKKNVNHNDYVEIGVDVEDYYKIKNAKAK